MKKRREQLGFTQTEVANQLHVTRQTISKWELGKSYPDLDLLISLSEFYDVSLDELLKGDQKLIKFFKNDSSETNGQQLTSAIFSLGVWLFFLVLLATSWLTQRVEAMTIMKKICFLGGTILNGSLFIISLIQVIQILLHKEKGHIREKKKSTLNYALNNKKNIYTAVGIVLMMSSLWCLQYNSINIVLLVPVYLLGLLANGYAIWLAIKTNTKKE
ncbi:helix-turn-helix domain-containing protein [Enterococcus sp. LJL99]